MFNAHRFAATDRFAWVWPVLLGLTVFEGALLLGLGAVGLTVEYDEAWILASVLRIADPAALPEVRTTLTTGGAHLALLGVAAGFGLPVIAAARGLSVVSVLGCIWVLDRMLRQAVPQPLGRIILAIFILSAPGTLIVGAMGYGVALAMLLFLLALALWQAATVHWLVRLIGCGLLLGLAMGTRWTFVPLLPVFAVVALIRPRKWSDVALGCGVGVLALGLFAGQLQLHIALAGGVDSQVLSANADAAGGAQTLLPSPSRAIGFLTKLGLLAPWPLLGLICAGGWWGLVHLPDRAAGFVRFAVLAAGILITAWILRAPFQHIRYIWPALLLVYAAAGIMIAVLHDCAQRMRNRPLALFCVVLTLGVAAGSYIPALRLAVMGAAMQTNAAGQDHLENHFTPLRLIQEQQAMRAALLDLPPQTAVMALYLPPEWSQMQLSLLSQRQIIAAQDWPDRDRLPDMILTHEYAQLDAAGWALLDQLGGGREIYGYRLFSVPATMTWDALPPRAMAPPYRFELERSQSLSGRPNR
jgi:hypothetical protein